MTDEGCARTVLRLGVLVIGAAAAKRSNSSYFLFFSARFFATPAQDAHMSHSQGLPRIRQKDNESSGKSFAQKERKTKNEEK